MRGAGGKALEIDLRFSRKSGKESSITYSNERIKTFAPIPVLAIPDVQTLDRTGSTQGPPQNNREDLSKWGYYNFLYGWTGGQPDSSAPCLKLVLSTSLSRPGRVTQLCAASQAHCTGRSVNCPGRNSLSAPSRLRGSRAYVRKLQRVRHAIRLCAWTVAVARAAYAWAPAAAHPKRREDHQSRDIGPAIMRSHLGLWYCPNPQKAARIVGFLSAPGENHGSHTQGQRPDPHARCRAGDAASVGAPGRAQSDRHQIRLRHRRLRCLHGACRRALRCAPARSRWPRPRARTS